MSNFWDIIETQGEIYALTHCYTKAIIIFFIIIIKIIIKNSYRIVSISFVKKEGIMEKNYYELGVYESADDKWFWEPMG